MTKVINGKFIPWQDCVLKAKNVVYISETQEIIQFFRINNKKCIVFGIIERLFRKS